jgi:hypothetical protein
LRVPITTAKDWHGICFVVLDVSVGCGPLCMRRRD